MSLLTKFPFVLLIETLMAYLPKFMIKTSSEPIAGTVKCREAPSIITLSKKLILESKRRFLNAPSVIMKTFDCLNWLLFVYSALCC